MGKVRVSPWIYCLNGALASRQLIVLLQLLCFFWKLVSQGSKIYSTGYDNLKFEKCNANISIIKYIADLVALLLNFKHRLYWTISEGFSFTAVGHYA